MEVGFQNKIWLTPLLHFIFSDGIGAVIVSSKRAFLSLSDALEIASKVEVRKWCGRSLPLLPESALKTKVTMFSVDLGGFDSGFQTTEKKSSKSALNFNLLDFFSVVFALPLLPESASKTKVTMFSARFAS